MTKDDLIKAVDEVYKQAKDKKTLEPDEQIPQTILAVDDTGGVMGLIPADPIMDAISATLTEQAIAQLEKKRLKKLTDEEHKTAFGLLKEKIHDTRADRDLAFYYIGGKLAQGEKETGRKAAGIVHAAEAWALMAKNKENIEGKVPSKDPNRIEIITVTGFTLDGKSEAGITTPFRRKGTGIEYDEENKIDESMQSNLFNALKAGYNAQKTAELKGEKLTPVDRTEALMQITLGSRLHIQTEVR